MLFLKDLNVFHIDGKEIPCITALGAPNVSYPGAPGVLYMDTGTGSLYKCIAANAMQEEYTWQLVGAVDPTTVQQAVVDYLEEHPVSGGGITSAVADLLITILRNGVYSADQSANITALAAELAVTEPEQPDIPVVPDEPDEPDEPAVTTYTVTNNLTNVVSSNGAVSVNEGASYTATLTAVEGYNLDTVTVTMGGVDITSVVYVAGAISIGTVSGDIVITATAKAEPVQVAMYKRMIDAGNTTLYSDGGNTELVPSRYVTYVCSEEIFAQDTDLTITIETNGTMYSEMYGCCYEAGFPADASDTSNKSMTKGVYHSALLFNSYIEVNKAGTYTKTYTVKAGYGLALVNLANAVAPVTGVTVTK